LIFILIVIYSLATVNFFLGCVGFAQVTRIFLYNRSLKNTTTVQEVKDAAKDVKETVEGIVKDPKTAIGSK
jgi:hypothetical protein